MSLENSFANTHLPFCLERQENGRTIVLNGKLQPLGFVSNKGLDYSKLPIATDLSFITEDLVPRIACWTESRGKRIYLCDDPLLLCRDSERMKAYVKRLGQLLFLTRQREINGVPLVIIDKH